MDLEAPKASPSRGSLLSLAASCALLALVLVPAGLLIGRMSAGRFDSFILQTALIATAVCWLAGSLALAAAHVGNRFGFPVQGLLLGMIFRMGLPLAAGIALNQVESLAAAGVFSIILGVYLCALLVETILSLRMVQPAAPIRPVAS